MKIIKRTNPSKIKVNNRKQTFMLCKRCSKEFGPVDRMIREYCSVRCARSTGRKLVTKTISKARTAQSLLKYHVDKGHIVRPYTCEECGSERYIEAAHNNYDDALDVKWLCVPCHRKMDKRNPRGVTYPIRKRYDNYVKSSNSDTQ